jgi:hypothetical protein
VFLPIGGGSRVADLWRQTPLYYVVLVTGAFEDVAMLSRWTNILAWVIMRLLSEILVVCLGPLREDGMAGPPSNLLKILVIDRFVMDPIPQILNFHRTVRLGAHETWHIAFVLPGMKMVRR